MHSKSSPVWFLASLAALPLFPLVFFTALSLAQSKDDRSMVGPKPLGQISGHVYRADTGEPISKTQVSLLPTDEATAKVTERRTLRTGPDGAFTFPDLPGGN
jgi:Carboxypeptidase regulatory-like domain